MRLLLCMLLGAMLFSSPGHAKMQGAQLQMLNKITTEVTKKKAVLGAPIEYGTLEITVRSCYEPPKKTANATHKDGLERAPEDTAALIDVKDFPPGEQSIHVFSGWMFVSSPALSAIEHPVYDIRVLGCVAK